jgi:sialic acid synthase SpsE
MPLMRIGGTCIGEGEALFVIAEIGLNHGGSVGRALELVDAAARAGATAVKVQTLIASELVAPACPAPAHVHAASLRDFFATFELDEAAHRSIATRARALGLGLIATPLSESAVDLLERVGVDAYKIASGDLTWTALVERCARTGKPLILSSGMGTIDEVGYALARARQCGAADVALLHCVSAYPVPQGSENLRAIATLAAAFGTPVGLSDHSADTFAVSIAVALGASLYERHLMLSSDDGSVDAAVSSTPDQLAAVVRLAARAAGALGSGTKSCAPAEAMNKGPSRRGLYASRALPAGHVVVAVDVIALRPASDVWPDRQSALIGSTLTRDLAAGAPFLPCDLRAQADSFELASNGSTRSISKGSRGVA